MAKVNFTVGRVEAFKCPAGKTQAFLWDAKAAGLALRVTTGGARAFIFQSRLRNGVAFRLTIGEPVRNDGSGTWSIPKAQEEARRLQSLIDQGADPRIERAAKVAEDAAVREVARLDRARLQVSGLESWAVYIEARRPRWSERHYSDHVSMSAEGGEPRKRLPGVKTQPGPLRSLLDRPLARIDAEAVEGWLDLNKERPARAALGFRLLVVFFNWLAEHHEYKGIAHAGACKARRTREQVVKPARKDDVLQREQLRAWFAEVRKQSPVAAAYLQTLLLVGARREELGGLRWVDIDFAWRSMRIGDKVEGSRVIPLTNHVAALLLDLKNRNETPPPTHRILHGRRVASDLEGWSPSPWVFSSKTSTSGRLVEPRIPHNAALEAAGLPPLTLHGLRRSFATLAEWTEAPVGVVAQVMGHQPSAIAEKHYRRRPLDLLRQWHQKIESFILIEAGVELAAAYEPNRPALALVQK